MADTSKFLQLAAILKLIDRERAKQLKHNAAASPDMSQKRLMALEESSRLCGVEIRRLKHEAHCLAVEIGIADRRSDEAYSATTAPLGFSREILIERRAPEGTTDSDLIDFLADPGQTIANVQLPLDCVEKHPDILRMAIRCAMSLSTTEGTNHE